MHVNSGIGSKAAFLVADGGTLNGRTVSGIGIARTAQVFWTVATVLPSSGPDADLGATLEAACATDVRNGVAGTTTANRTQVASAATATGVITS